MLSIDDIEISYSISDGGLHVEFPESINSNEFMDELKEFIQNLIWTAKYGYQLATPSLLNEMKKDIYEFIVNKIKE